MSEPTVLLPIAVVLLALMVAAVTDVWKFKVHNWLTVPLLLSGLIYNGATGGWTGLVDSAFGVLLGIGILLAFYLMGGIGAGDLKLMAGIGAWLGTVPTFFVFLAGALAAGVYAVVLIVLCQNVRETLLNLQIIWHRVGAIWRHLGAEDNVESVVDRTDRRRRAIPFAAMMLLGFVGLLILTTWMTHRQ